MNGSKEQKRIKTITWKEKKNEMNTKEGINEGEHNLTKNKETETHERFICSVILFIAILVMVLLQHKRMRVKSI